MSAARDFIGRVRAGWAPEPRWSWREIPVGIADAWNYWIHGVE